jgi:hypothetical protein
MRFLGAVNVGGLLSPITVQPPVVTVRAGCEVEFVNATSFTLTLSVGSESAQIGAGASASMRFIGAPGPQTFAASVTALGGSLTSFTGRIQVRARPAADPPTAADGQPGGVDHGSSAAPSPQTWPQEPAASGSPGTSESSPAQGAVVPVSPDATGLPSARATAQPEQQGRAGEPGDRSGSGEPTPTPTVAAKIRPSPVLPPFPGFATTRDQLGLVILLSAAVVAGLVAALIRTLLAYRPLVLVGAHSQAARKARRQRRTR